MLLIGSNHNDSIIQNEITSVFVKNHTKGPLMSLNLVMGDSFSILYIFFSYVYSIWDIFINMHNGFGVTVIFQCQLGFVNSLHNQIK